MSHQILIRNVLVIGQGNLYFHLYLREVKVILELGKQVTFQTLQ